MEHLHDILIKKFMTRDPLVLGPGDTTSDAYIRMRNHQIRHLPVVSDAGELVGLFSASDLNRAYTPRETESGWYYEKEGMNMLDLNHFMTKDPLTLTPENTLIEAAEIMSRTKYGCLPIVEAGSRKLVGIVSYIDVLKEIAKHY